MIKNVFQMFLSIGLIVSSAYAKQQAPEPQLIAPDPIAESALRSLNPQDWQDAEYKAQNTVVQVWTQRAEANVLEPYKAPEQQQVCGTAFFINSNGDLLTNYHVVEQAKSIFINIPSLGKKALDVHIIGVCPELDVALLGLSSDSFKIATHVLGKIPFLELDDSDALYRTQPVLALGYPLGFRYLKSTVGVVAGREYLDGRSFIHITAPINPGNSGGPLLNQKGKVCGINSAGILSAQNVGYIIPINDVKNILNDLYTKKLFRRPHLGIRFNHATDEHARSLNNPIPGGIYITYVQKDSVAECAGIKPKDMLYGISCAGNYYDIDEYGDVTVGWRTSDKVSVGELLMRISAGENLKLVAYRNGERIESACNFDVAALSPIRRIYPDFEPEELRYVIIAGACFMVLRENHLVLMHPTSTLKKYARKENASREVVVMTHILPGSPIHRAVEHFYPGSLVKTVNGQKIRNLDDLESALLLSVETGEISLESHDKFATVLSLEKVLAEEARLSWAFMYPVSDITKKLKQLYDQKQHAAAQAAAAA